MFCETLFASEIEALLLAISASLCWSSFCHSVNLSNIEFSCVFIAVFMASCILVAPGWVWLSTVIRCRCLPNTSKFPAPSRFTSTRWQIKPASLGSRHAGCTVSDDPITKNKSTTFAAKSLFLHFSNCAGKPRPYKTVDGFIPGLPQFGHGMGVEVLGALLSWPVMSRMFVRTCIGRQRVWWMCRDCFVSGIP